LTPIPAGENLAPYRADPAAVRAHLERILLSALFRNSKQYPALLRYVVEQELNGASSELKERTIAIDVFGREPTYDPGADPVVRISAGEVRKRLAQYYQETTGPGICNSHPSAAGSVFAAGTTCSASHSGRLGSDRIA
jgi:hypothetical protein